jgi:hypothetical protein
VRCSTTPHGEERLLTSIYELHAFFQFISFLLHVSSKGRRKRKRSRRRRRMRRGGEGEKLIVLF